MDIIVEIKSHFGNEQIYPICEKAKLFALIAGTKTLTRKVIREIEQLGYEIKIKAPTL